MDWTNERYVRLYIRDTTTWKRIGWDGQCVLMQLLRKVDRSGVLPLDDMEPWEAIMLHTDAPEDTARRGTAALLRVGTVEVRGTHLVMPNYLAAQECVKSDALRAKEYRERRASSSFVTNSDGIESRNVTNASQVDQVRHAASRGVTPSLTSPNLSEPSQAEPNQAKPNLVIAVEPSAATAKRRRPAALAKPKPPPPTADLWEAYSEAYQARYDVPPVRNATVNGQLARVLGRLGGEEAPEVARWYLRSQNARYVASGHPVGLLLQDAEKLRTEWATGRQATAYAARVADKQSGRLAEYEDLFAEMRALDAAREA